MKKRSTDSPTNPAHVFSSALGSINDLAATGNDAGSTTHGVGATGF